MGNEYKTELYRAFRGTGFLMAAAAGLLIAFLDFAVMILPLREHIMEANYPLSVFAKWMGGENASVFPTLYYFIVPILAALPFAGSYKSDIKTGYFKNIAVRVSRKKYLRAKYIATFLSGGSVAVLPLIVNFMMVAMVLPAVKPQASTGYFPIFSYSMLGDLFYAHPYWYLAVYIGIDFIFFGLLATLALGAGYLCENLFTTILAPFIAYLFVYAVTQITNLHMFCPFGFLRPSQPIAARPEILLAEMAIMGAAGGVYYYWGSRQDIF